MAAPVWQPGTLYLPGDLVQPITQPAPNNPQVINGYFEEGPTGWTFSGDAAYSTSGGYGSPRCVVLPGNKPDGVALNNAQLVVPVGAQLTATCMIQQGASSAGETAGWAEVRWYDALNTLLQTDKGNAVDSGSNGAWHPSTVTSTAPASAAYARAAIHLTSVATHNHEIFGDNLVVNGATAGLPEGLVYKAVQTESGTSGSSEPAWPGILGQQVIDNEVIWEAVTTSRVVWTASPRYVSGATEPVWPTDIGAMVQDGSINWRAVSRRVEDEKCPRSKVVAIVASKVFAADKDIVRYSATANPLDWSTAEDAGYLPTGLQQANANNMAVLQQYRANLVALNASSFQNWQVDPDPASMAILDQMDGIGSTWQRAAVPVANDLFYLSQLGVRTIGIANAAENLAAGDVGAPIDELIRQALMTAGLDLIDPVATYFPGAGQYWLAFKNFPPPDIIIAGELPSAQSGFAYDGRLLVSNAIGNVTAMQVGGDQLPAGAQIVTIGSEIAVQWPPAVFSSDQIFALSISAQDSVGRTAVWSGSITAEAERIPTWSLSKKGSSFTVADGVIASSEGGTAIQSVAILSNFPKTSGKWYVEIRCSAGAAGNVTFRAGLARGSHVVEGLEVGDAGLGAGADSWCMTAANGECYFNGNFQYFGSVDMSIDSPDERWGIAYDAATGGLWLRKVGAGTWRGGGNPATGVLPSYVAESGLHFAASLSSLGGTPPGEFTIVDRQDATIPPGFSYWSDV